MKSIKPGRGPLLGNAISSIFAAVFGVIWTCAAIWIGAPFFFPLFGVVFIIAGVVHAVYSLSQATSDQRHSAFDIVDEREEPDPLNVRLGKEAPPPANSAHSAGFCPYCGAPTKSDYTFCRKCGRQLPQ